MTDEIIPAPVKPPGKTLVLSFREENKRLKEINAELVGALRELVEAAEARVEMKVPTREQITGPARRARAALDKAVRS